VAHRAGAADAVADGGRALVQRGADEDRPGGREAAVGAGERHGAVGGDAAHGVDGDDLVGGGGRRGRGGRGGGAEQEQRGTGGGAERGAEGRGAQRHGGYLPVWGGLRLPPVPVGRATGRDPHPFGGESAPCVGEPSRECPGAVTLGARPFHGARDGRIVEGYGPFGTTPMWRCAMCAHQPSCARTDCPAPHVAVARPEQGWTLTCDGAIVFDDSGEPPPDGRVVAPPRAPAGPLVVAALTFGAGTGTRTRRARVARPVSPARRSRRVPPAPVRLTGGPPRRRPSP